MAKDRPVGNMKFGIGFDGVTETLNTLDKVNKALKQQETAMKASMSAMDKGSKSLQDLGQEEKDLLKVREIQDQKLKVLNKRLDDNVKKYGEESVQASKVKNEINKLTVQQNKYEKQLVNTQKEMIQMENGLTGLNQELQKNEKEFRQQATAMKKAGDETGALETLQVGLQKKLDLTNQAAQKQENAIQDLTQKFGKNSKEVKEAQQQLEKYAQEAKNTGSELGSVEKGLGGITSGADKSKGGLDLAGASLQGLVAGVAMSISTKALEMISSAASQITENINAGIEAVNMLSGVTGKAQLGKEFASYANQLVGKGIADDLEMASDAIIKTNEVLGRKITDPLALKEIAENALALEQTTGADLTESLRGASRMMENYGISAQEAFDFLAKGAQNGLDQTDELGDNMAEYSQIWAQMGFSADNTFSILQAGLDGGAYNLDKVNDLVKEMGVSLTDGRFEENIGMFTGETQNLFNAWKNGDATQAEVVKSMMNDFGSMEGGYDALNKAGTVWSALGEDNSLKVIQAMAGASDSYGLVVGNMQQLERTASNTTAMEAFSNSLKAIGGEIGISLAPMMGDMANKVTDFTDDILPKIGPAIKSMIDIAMPYIKKFSEIFATGLKIAGDVLRTLGDYFMKELWPIIQPALEKLWERISKLFDYISTWWNANGTKIMNAIKGFLELITPLFKLAIDMALQFADSVVGFIEGAVETITGVIDFFTSMFEGDLNGMWEAVKKIFFGAIKTIWNWINISFIGKITKGIGGLAKGAKSTISGMWASIKSFFSGGIKNAVSSVTNFASNLLSKFGSIKTNVTNSVSSLWKGIKNTFSGGIDTIVKWFTNLPSKLGDAISGGAKFVKDAFKGIFNGVLSAIGGPVNGIIGGANWVLEKFGAPTISKWDVPQYADGTDGHPGGPMLVNDGRGAEAVISPNGQMTIPQGKNVMMYGQKGTQVIPAEQTAQMLGKKAPRYRYKNGTGFWGGVKDTWGNIKDWTGNAVQGLKDTIGDVMDFVGNPFDLAKKAIGGVVNLDGMGGLALKMASGLKDKAIGAFTEKVKALFKKKEEDDARAEANGDWEPVIRKAARIMGQDVSNGQVQGLLAQIQRESGGNPKIIQDAAVDDENMRNGNPARGLLQYIPQTFDAFKVNGYGNIYSGLDQLVAFFNNSNWRNDLQYGKSGWGPNGGRIRGYFNGGIAKNPQIASLAENGYPEIIIPTEPSKRNRAMMLLNQARHMLGVKDKAQLGTQTTGSNETALLVSLMQQQNELLQAILAKDSDVYMSGKKVNDVLNNLNATNERNQRRDLGLV